MKQFPLCLALLLTCLCGQPARAWAEAPPAWKVSLGLAAVTTPAFHGAADYQLSLFPDLKLAYGELVSFAMPAGFKVRLLQGEAWRVAMTLRYVMAEGAGRDNPFRIIGDDDDRDILHSLGKRPAAFEPGVGGEYRLGSVTVRSEVRSAVSGYEGTVAEIGATWRGKVAIGGPPLLVAAGPRLSLADAAYQRVYYGIDSAQSAASGLPRHEPGGGITAAGANLLLILPVVTRTSLVGYVGYDCLLGAAADSPLVRAHGSPHQFVGGLGFSYELF